MIVSTLDTYAIARAVKGLDWQHLPVDPLIGHLLGNLQASDTTVLFRLLGTDVLTQVFAADPYSDPPLTCAAPCLVKTEPPKAEAIPELPPSARLTAAQEQDAQRAGRWLRDYTSWAGSTANETPLSFHEGAGLFLGGMAIGRRLYVAAPWGETVFPNLYLMLAAVSTYYRKTASLRLATNVARAAMPHMLLPEPGSPENLMNLLAGKLPGDFSELPPSDQERLKKASAFAAQRCIIRDEISGLFKSMGRDYMSGMKERIMQMYDCPSHLEFSTNGKGLVIVRDVAPSIFGAATPAELAYALSPADWQNGTLARFALLTPEPDYKERPAPVEYTPPDALVTRLQALHERLPLPPSANAYGEKAPTEAWSLVAPVWDHCRAYEQALREITAPGGFLDDRLRATYGRLHVQALKVAIILAALDWADAAQTDTKPVVEAVHWWRAQQITEAWRASAHRLLDDLSDNTYSQTEAKILGLLNKNAAGLTKSELMRLTHLSARALDEALNLLVDSAVIEQGIQQKSRGPAAKIYKVV